MLALPQGAAETGADAPDAAGVRQRVPGQERRQVGGDADRAHAGAAAAVRDAEGLVQVDVADVGADVAGAAEADLRVQVGAVHVDLAAVLVDDLGDVLDPGLEHAVRRRVGHHQRGERVAVLARLGGEIGEIDVAAVVAGDDHDAVAGHHRRRRVGAVRRRRDQADVAVPLAAALVKGADDEQAGVLPLRAGVRLQRRRGEAGDRATASARGR